MLRDGNFNIQGLTPITRLGIVAGWGELPFMVIKGAREKGVHFIAAVGFEGHTDPKIAELVDDFSWIGVGQLNKLINIFKKNEINKAVMAGRLGHTIIFSNIKFDLRMVGMVARLKDRRADTILGAIANELQKDGIELVDSTGFLRKFLPEPGVLTETKLSDQMLEDVEFGKKLAKNVAGLDIGQTVVVKDKAVLAVEAMEGTDEAILRGGRLGKSGAVVVKVSKPNQDMRFDVPVIGLDTIKVLKEAKISCLAIEAGKTIILDKKAVLKEAKAAGIAIVAI